MTTISIPLTEEQVARLHDQAREAGLSPEEFLRRRVEEVLARPDESFRAAAEYVLRKNAELYRRLA